MTHHLKVAPEVRAALDAGAPVIALESTIISHGFPYPANLECALAAEEAARTQGAVPATIALIGGEIRVGLDSIGLEHLATAPGIAKVSRRDLATLVASGSDGATTVAATMMIAEMAGIRVFATGGIGGVHRGAETSFDISADLEELARTDVAVVCAGAKSVLDLGLTLEYLETHGVPVLGYCTDEFPAFYTRTSGFGVDARLDTAEEVAAVLRARRELGIAGGVVVANPIPPEFELAHAQIDGVIETALAEAAEQGVRGKAVTPFLLGRIHALTGGASETANKELVYNNVRLAAQIAGALSEGAR
ncbi:MAG: pseudouridine-5-phosphate glycosidase [Actinobacteria bacterium HGW-Actinobacteria-1]|nr:MAG: pseudouridine-5-phosphate glycosidase [Actinobacteria bacterium HGW-Actinobacteria-1]